VGRLGGADEPDEAQVAVARTGDQYQPVFCLMRRDVHASLREFLGSGQRKIDRWYPRLRTTIVAFDDEADAFRNINTLEELDQLSPASPPTPRA
jgi:molybdopterin-guanine dinucleotide biosynthesis protein A